MPILLLALILLFTDVLTAQGNSPLFSIQQIEIGSDPTIPNQYLIGWSLVASGSDDPISYGPEDEISGEVVLTVRNVETGEIIAQPKSTTFANVANLTDIPLGDSFNYSAEVILSLADGGGTVISGPVDVLVFVQDIQPPGQKDCDRILAAFFEAKSLCEKDTSALESALESAQVAYDEAEFEMHLERARRAQIQSELAEADKKRNRLFNQEARQQAEKIDRENDLFESARQYWADRSNMPTMFLRGPAPGDNYTSVDLGGGVSLYFDRAHDTAAEGDHYSRLAQLDSDAYWSRGIGYRDLIDAIENICSDIEATQKEIADCDALIGMLIRSGNHQGPYDLDFQAAAEALQRAQSELDECLLTKQAACARAEQLAEELEKCLRENELAGDLGEAVVDGEDAENDLTETDGFLKEMPEGVRGSDSSADQDANEAERLGDESKKCLEEARQAAANAKAAIAAGDLEEAERQAAIAKSKSAAAKNLAAQAKQRAQRALIRGQSQADNVRRKAMIIRENELRDLTEWQCKREACIRFILDQTLGELPDDLTFDEIEDLKSALSDIISISGDADTAIDILQQTDAGPGTQALLASVQGKLRAAINTLNSLKDKIDGLSDTIEELAQLKANLDSILTDIDPDSPDAPIQRARQFGAWLNLLGEGLDRTLSKLPFAQILTGYLTFLFDSYTEAIEAIDEIQRIKFENALQSYLGQRNCGIVLLRLKQAQENGTDLIEFFVNEARNDSNINVALSGDEINSANFRLIVSQLMLKKLTECCEGQLTSVEPEISYSMWLDGFIDGGVILFSESLPVKSVIIDPFDINADGSGDGIPNFVKYFFNQDPRLLEPIPFQIKSVEFGPDQLALTFPRLRGVTGVEYTVEESSSLGADASWTEITGLQEFYPQIQNRIDEVYAFPLATEDQSIPEDFKFYRIRILIPESDIIPAF